MSVCVVKKKKKKLPSSTPLTHSSSLSGKVVEWTALMSMVPPQYVPRFFLVFSWRKSRPRTASRLSAARAPHCDTFEP